jgi:hypothetical protein
LNCQNHPLAVAAAQCNGCAESFCANCLVPMNGGRYCASCKSMALPTGGGATAVAITRESEDAAKALKYAIIGIFCFGIILEPLAIQAALRAKKEIEADPTIGGLGKANAALVIGSVALVLWVLGMIARFSAIR